VDVARSMIAVARREAHRGHRCEFVVNRSPHLRRFPDATFDFVHSCLVLQHMPPSIALGYVGEFLRICRPGGIVVFQLPAETYAEQVISDRYALRASAYSARIVLSDPPASLVSSEATAVRMVVTNESAVTWRHDIPAGRHITIANHWLRADGTVAVPDDGRAYLPRTLEPGESCEVELGVHAPVDPAGYILEVDLVQERVCWFAERGSTTARARVTILPVPGPSAPDVPESIPAPPVDARPSLLQRILHPFRQGTPTFEMHVVPRLDVERVIRNAGGELLHAIDDDAAGYRWLSYTYVCRRV
jgi:SAM-dependent methyltransferase